MICVRAEFDPTRSCNGLREALGAYGGSAEWMKHRGLVKT